MIAGLDLDDRSATPTVPANHPTLRWVLLHLVEENARHNGHLDLLRELTDGRPVTDARRVRRGTGRGRALRLARQTPPSSTT